MGSAVSVLNSKAADEDDEKAKAECLEKDNIEAVRRSMFSMAHARTHVNNFVRVAMANHLNVDGIRVLLQDKLAMVLFKRYVVDKLQRDDDIWEVIENAIATNQDNASEEAHVDRLIPIALMSAFSGFLDSHYFAQWMASSTASTLSFVVDGCDSLLDQKANRTNSGKTELSIEDDVENQSLNLDEVKVLGEVKQAGSLAPIASAFRDAAVSRVAYLDLCTLLREDSWLTTLIASVETLPLAFSISSADSKNYGFPLIYVNKCFESLTGYPRSNILGKNCRFLQECLTSPENTKIALENNAIGLNAMAPMLSRGRAMSVQLDNFRRDGSVFRNYLILKPLFDQKGAYRYIVGLQYELTEENNTPEDKALNKHLFRLLPDVLYVDE